MFSLQRITHISFQIKFKVRADNLEVNNRPQIILGWLCNRTYDLKLLIPKEMADFFTQPGAQFTGAL